MCKKGLCVSNVYLGHKCVHTFTRVARVLDGMEAEYHNLVLMKS